MKLPSHSRWCVPCVLTVPVISLVCLLWYFVSAEMVSLCLQSLYMLNSVSFPHSPCNLIAVTSPDMNSSCSHPSVNRSSLISIRVLVFPGSFVCVLGYTTFHSRLAMVLLKALMAGSCSATISIPFSDSFPLLIKSCWHVRDLLMFCCQIVMCLFPLLFAVCLSFILH